MNGVIIDLSRYTILLFFGIYTVYGAMGLLVKNKKRVHGILIRQRIFFFATHLNCYLAILVNDPNVDIVVFYAGQLIFFFFMMKAYQYLYEDGSELLLNNMLMLMSIGFIMLTRLDMHEAVRQFIIAAVAGVLSLFVPFLVKEIKFLRNITWIYAGIGFAGLAIVYLIGTVTGGAKLSLDLWGFKFQVSELVKILFVFFVASIFTISTDFLHVVIATVIAAMHVAILVMSTDLGAALIFFITYLVMLYVASKKWYYLIAGLLAGSGASVVAYKLFGHVRRRVQAWRDPLAEIDGTGFQISQSLFALGGGGWFGSGLTDGMPQKVPLVDSDFIFAAVAEELGAVFAICMILVCLSCFIMMLNIATELKEPFYKYLALGLGTLYVFQVFLNIGGVIKFIPSTGLTLPFVSYGGTSMVCSVFIFSLIQGLYTMRKKPEKKKPIQNKKRKQIINE